MDDANLNSQPPCSAPAGVIMTILPSTSSQGPMSPSSRSSSPEMGSFWIAGRWRSGMGRIRLTMIQVAGRPVEAVGRGARLRAPHGERDLALVELEDGRAVAGRRVGLAELDGQGLAADELRMLAHGRPRLAAVSAQLEPDPVG